MATGVALAEQFKGSGAVTVAFLGDGTLGEGAVYEALNMAALWQAPIVFVLEHNQYAQSTPTERTTAGAVTARAEAFGIRTNRRPADDPVALQAHMREVVERVRGGAGPFFQVLDTYRLAAHSKGDDDRDPHEIAEYRRRDPLVRLRAQLGETVAAPLAAAAEARVDAAVAAAGAAGEPTTLVVQHLNAALHTMMAERTEVVLLGEDLHDPYGGAFKVSRGLSTRFPTRVFSTPISEAGFIGVGTGLGLRGFRPIVEDAIGIGFEEDEVIAEYVVPSQLAPLRLDPILDSVRRTGRLLVVEEGTAPWGFGAELIARVAEALQARVPRCARVAAHHLPIPNARPAEDLVLPDAARVVAAMRALL